MEQVIKAGTVVHIGGFPYAVAEDTKVIGATPLPDNANDYDTANPRACPPEGTAR